MTIKKRTSNASDSLPTHSPSCIHIFYDLKKKHIFFQVPVLLKTKLDAIQLKGKQTRIWRTKLDFRLVSVLFIATSVHFFMYLIFLMWIKKKRFHIPIKTKIHLYSKSIGLYNLFLVEMLKLVIVKYFNFLTDFLHTQTCWCNLFNCEGKYYKK